MILKYHKGKNFGDALNPLIFDHYLKDFFDNDKNEVFYGIGSILGFVDPAEKRKIIFSSGYAYGSESTYGPAPVIDESFDVVCVRGPLTAKILKIDPKLAVTDGAVLLKNMVGIQPVKKYKFSFIPHVGSHAFFSDWGALMEPLGIHYIDPAGEPMAVMEEILKSECIIAEAMHGAIVADTLRVPWIPVKLYHTINDFKWQDYLRSVELEYEPNLVKGLFSKTAVRNIIDQKFNKFPGFVNAGISSMYSLRQKAWQQRKFNADMKKIMSEQKVFLSADTVLSNRYDTLLEKLEQVKNKYRRR